MERKVRKRIKKKGQGEERKRKGRRGMERDRKQRE